MPKGVLAVRFGAKNAPYADYARRLAHSPDAPGWMKRAMNPANPHTPQNESVRSASVGTDAGEIVFPTIRMRKGKRLERLTVPEAAKESIRRKDFVILPSIPAATTFSKEFSNELGRVGERFKNRLNKRGKK